MFFDVTFLLLIGILAGISSGMFGVGGGVIFVPAIYFYLSYIGVDDNIIPFVSIATSLFAGSLSSLSSFVNHYIIKNIDFKKAFLLSSGSVVTAVLTPFFVIKIQPSIFRYVLIVILVLVALKMFIENGNKNKSSEKKLSNLFLIFFGFIVGIISSFSGLGGGVIFVPLLVYFYSLDIKRAVGTSALVVFFTMLSSAITFALIAKGNGVGINQIGYVNYFIGIILGGGAIIGATFGVRLVKTLNSIMLKKIFAIFIIIVIIKMFF
ncbi:MAG: sulfite exporter TauE/SafE family protein, partial [Ignavibacteriales bacterium]|nr:sulfite exporter TauE/SafE family protein [Ignavibacteriales bacterium]